MKKKKQPRNPGGPVLDGYKKVGTTFVPPLVHKIGPLDVVSWNSQTMPELIWWELFSDHSSHRFAARVAEEIARHFKPRENRQCWWAFISDYAHLSDEDTRRGGSKAWSCPLGRGA